MSICPKNKSSKARRDSRRANWKMSAPNLVKCSTGYPPLAFATRRSGDSKVHTY